MGDYRASIRVKWEMAGIKHDADMWINWSPNDDGIDNRLVEMFRGWGNEGRSKIDEEIYESQRDSCAKEVEAHERAELARLQMKYKEK